MKKILFILLLSVSVFFAQEIEIEQLTNINGEIRNPTFAQYTQNWPGWYYDDYSGKVSLFFEIYEKSKFDSSSNIAYLNFSESETKFEEKIHYITNENSSQRNVSVTAIPKMIAIWETNRRGNWDIEYSIRIDDSTWSSPKLLYDSSEDETNAKFIRMVERHWGKDGYEDRAWITFESNNKIYLAEFQDSLRSIEPIFSEASNYEFSNSIGCLNGFNEDARIYVAAEMRESGNPQSKIVLTDRHINSTEWRELAIISDSGNSHSPDFIQTGFFYDEPYVLSFEVEHNNRNNVNLLMDDDYYNTPYSSGWTELRSDSQLSTYDFYSYMYFVVAKGSVTKDFIYYYPNIFKAVRNDSTFVAFSQYDFYNREVYLHVYNQQTEIDVGPVGAYTIGMLSYMVWTEFTANGINLFGSKRYDHLGSVNDGEELKNSITLSQNYPNPFNPTTKIKFSLPNVVDEKFRPQQTKLIVYDILGREIKTLINKPMQPGEYEVEFDATDLPSGVYFYRLTSGVFNQTRKMVLLR